MPPRFHIHRPIGPDDATVALSPEESRHLARVLRLEPGEQARVFDPSGAEWDAVVERATPRGSTLRLVKRLEARERPGRKLALAVSLIRNEPLSWLVEKATELGVERVLPFVSARTVVTRGEGSESQQRRWGRISLAACKQSGRNHPLEIAEPQPFDALLASNGGAGLALFAWEGGDAPPLGKILAERSKALRPDDWIVLAIGPEGGFSPEEQQRAREKGWTAVDLGPNILRAETAALAGAAMILLWPD